MRQIKWTRNTKGTLNGKVGHVTLFTVSYYPERGYFVAPKLPGLNKTVQVDSEETGKRKAESLYRGFIDFLKGGEWYPEYNKPNSTNYTLSFSKNGNDCFERA